MKKIILPGLALYTVSSGMGLFLGPRPSNPLMLIWLTGFVVLALALAYHSFFIDKGLNLFPYIILGILILNFFIQITGGAQSSLWPAYFLFAAAVAVFAPLRQTYATAALILLIEASNLLVSGQMDPGKWPVYAGFSLSLFGVSTAMAHIIQRVRNEADRAKDENERLIAKAEAIDPLADENNLESLASRQAANLKAASERDTTFSGLIDMISRFVPAHSYALFLKERRENGEVFVLRAIRTESPAAASAGTELRGKTYIDICADQKQRQYISDISGIGTPLANLGYYRENARNVQVRTFLAVPIIQDGRTIGVFALDSLEPGAFSLEDQDTLSYFEPFFIQIIEKIKMTLLLKTRADHFGALHEISTELNSSLKFGEIMDRILPMINRLVPCDFCACVLRTELDGKPYLQFAALKGYNAGFTGRTFPFEDSAVIVSMNRYWQERGVLSYYANDCGNRGRDIRLFPFHELQQPIRSLYGRLLVAKEASIGAFFLASVQPDAFSEYQRNHLLDTLMNQISLVAYNSQLYQRIEDLARSDGLTGLLNHRTFMEKLAEEYKRIDREQRPFSILIMDIDKFKNVNDAYGHPVGDLAIKAVAKVLRETVRTTDFVARYGGEEFAVGMVDTNSRGAGQMAERVRATMEKTIVTRIGPGDLMITLSVGVASFPEHTGNISELLNLADSALYEAKGAGRNRVCIHKDGAENKSAVAIAPLKR